MNILVVEDQAVVREMLTAVAFSALPGSRVHSARDLEEGLAAARASAIDLVLLDLGLPGCRGVDAVKRFRQAFPQVTIVVVSSNEDAQVVSEALQAGAASFIPKALSVAGIASVLRGSRSNQPRHS